MKIYLFRHAQKAMDFSGNPNLNPDGHAQASKLLDKVLQNKLAVPDQLWVSPSIRTHETFRPLANHFNLELKSESALLEQQAEENRAQFCNRIENFLKDVSNQKKYKTLYICTHYDWLIEAMALIPSDTDLSTSEFSHWSPCQYVAFDVDENTIFNFITLKRI